MESSETKTKFILLSQVAKRTGYTPEYLNLLSRKGILKSQKVGRNWNTTEEWLDEFLVFQQGRQFSKYQKKTSATNLSENESAPDAVFDKEMPAPVESIGITPAPAQTFQSRALGTEFKSPIFKEHLIRFALILIFFWSVSVGLAYLLSHGQTEVATQKQSAAILSENSIFNPQTFLENYQEKAEQLLTALAIPRNNFSATSQNLAPKDPTPKVAGAEKTTTSQSKINIPPLSEDAWKYIFLIGSALLTAFLIFYFFYSIHKIFLRPVGTFGWISLIIFFLLSSLTLNQFIRRTVAPEINNNIQFNNPFAANSKKGVKVLGEAQTQEALITAGELNSRLFAYVLKDSLKKNQTLAGDVYLNWNDKLKLERNTVKSREIVRHAIEAEDIDTNSITSRTIRNHTIQGEDINPDTEIALSAINATSITSDSGNFNTLTVDSQLTTYNLQLDNILDFGVNTIADGNFVGDWDFSGGSLTDINSVTGTTGTLTTLNLTTLDLGINTIADGNFTGDWNFNGGDLITMGTLNVGATTLSGNLDMQNNLVLNIGNAGTDFTTGGGLTLAGSLTVNGIGTNYFVGSIFPSADISVDLGDPTHRFNNLYSANIITAAISTSGQAVFNYQPINTNYAESSVLINPTTTIADAPLLGIGVGGVERLRIDEDGDLTTQGNISGGTYNGNTISTGTGILTLSSYTLAMTGNSNINQNLLTTSSPTFAGLTLNGNLILGVNTLTTTNTTLVSNLNADYLDGQHGAYYAPAGNISGTDNYIAKFNGTSALENSVIYDDGTNVGIGTTSPTGKLHVFNSSGNTDLVVDAPSGSYSAIQLAKAGTNIWSFYRHQTTDDFRIIEQGVGDRFTLQKGTGNVGIGTTNPTERLVVAGGNLLVAPNSWGKVNIRDDFWGMSGVDNQLRFKMSTNAASSIAFGATASGEASDYSPLMTLLSNGNVGIGTTGPQAKLDVIGDNARIGSVGTALGTGYALEFSTNSSLPRIDFVNAGNYIGQISSNNTDALFRNNLSNTGNIDFQTSISSVLGSRLYIKNTGNVGIGTTGPANPLSIQSAGTTSGLKITNTNSFSAMQLSPGQAGDVDWLVMAGYPNAGDFNIRQNNVGDFLTIKKTTGNVGIGTTGPGGLLEVSSGSVGVADTVGGAILSTRYHDGAGSYRGGSMFSYYNSSINLDQLVFGLSGNVAGTDNPAQYSHAKMVINENGNVGIGTTNPGESLDVNGNAYIGTANGVMRITTSPNNVWLQGYNAARTGTMQYMNFSGYQGTNRTMTLDLINGNVGIGTTGPTAKLQVVGSTGLPASSGTTQTGTMRLQVSGYGTVLDFGAVGPSTGTQWIQATDASNLALTYPLLLNPNGGNVGIGTTNPGAKLDIMDSNATGAAIRLREGATNGIEYIGLKAPDILAASQTYILPATVGTVNQVLSLVTVATGQLGWAANSSSGMSNPLTVTGDTIYASNTATPATAARLAIGTAGQCLVVSAGLLPSWGACSGVAGVAGATTQVQYNLGGVLSATANFTWDNTNFTLSSLGSVDGNKTSLALRNTSTGNTAVDSLHIGNDTAVDTFDLWTNSSTNTTGANAAFIYNRQAAPLVFGTNNAEAMRILSNGNVGIGTTAPSRLLHLKMVTTSFPTLGTANGHLFLSPNDGLWGMYMGNNNATGAGWIQQMRNDSAVAYPLVLQPSGGNVGIGTTNPSYKTVVSNSGAEGLELGPGYVSGKVLLQAYNRSGGAYNQMDFAGSLFTFNNSGVEKVRIDASGNVGIGTTNPTQKLTVSSTAAYDGILSTNSNRQLSVFKSTGEHSWLYIDSAHSNTYLPKLSFQRLSTTYGEIGLQRASSSDVLGAYVESEMLAGTTGATPFSLQTNGVRRIVIDTTGNVGIGTTASAVKLEVDGSSTSWPATIGTTQTGTLRVKAANNGTLDMGSNGSNGAWLQATNVGDLSINYSLILNPNGGNIGIGTTAPGSKLDISGIAQDSAELRLREATDHGVSYIGFTAPHDITNSLTYTFPEAPGTTGFVLASTTAGVMSWVDNAAGSGMTNPMLTIGDLIYGSATGTPATPARLGIGTAGQVLETYDSGGGVLLPRWGSGGGIAVGGDGTPAGQIQFSTGGGAQAMDGDDEFYYDTTNKELSIIGSKAGSKRLQVTNTLIGTSADSGINLGNDSAADQLSLRINSSAFTTYGGYSYLWSKANAPMVFGTNNAAAMTILGNGNVGIGTTGPETLLYLNSTNPVLTINAANGNAEGAKIRLSESAQFQGGYIQYDGSANVLNIGVHNAIDFTVANDLAAISILRSNGNVGIGTAGPGNTLDVLGTDSTGSSSIGNIARFLAGAEGIIIGAHDVSDYSFIQTTNAHNFSLNPNGGNVGIGTTNPRGQFHILAGSSAANAVAAPIILARYWNSDTETRAASIFEFTDATNDKLAFAVSGDGGSNNAPNSIAMAKMVIQANGNVGIGTTGPLAALSVNGDFQFLPSTNYNVAQSQAIYFASNYSSAGTYATIAAIHLMRTTILHGEYDSAISFDTRKTGSQMAEVMRINNQGNVGIGTTNPGGGTGTHVLSIFNSAAPTALANTTHLYSVAGEGYWMDAAGNAALQTPHDLQTGKWIFSSTNVNTERTLRVEMEDLTKNLDTILGGGYVFENGEAVYQGENIITGLNTQLSVQTQSLASLQLKTDTNITTIVGLQSSIDKNLLVIQGKLDDLSDEQIKTINEQIAGQAGDIANLESQYNLIQSQYDTITKFLAISDGVYDLKAGILKAAGINVSGQLEAGGVVAGAFTVKIADLERKTIGQATIAVGGQSIIINTKAVSANSKIFVTPTDSSPRTIQKTIEQKSGDPIIINIPITWSVKDQIIGTSFTIETSELVSEEMKFNWWIVEEK